MSVPGALYLQNRKVEVKNVRTPADSSRQSNDSSPRQQLESFMNSLHAVPPDQSNVVRNLGCTRVLVAF